MKIHGLMKMTLLDFPGKVACTVFLGGCDLRCPFCHNSELLDMGAPAQMEEEELYAFLRKRVGLLDGVAFTGGEPLLRTDLIPVMRKIRDMGFEIKLDTNGTHPQRLKEIVSEGLVDYVAMDIKNSPDKYGVTCGLPDLDISNVSESIQFLLSDAVDYEFRTTVVSPYHDEESFQKIGPWIEGAKRYFLQEFVDRETVKYQGLSACTEAQMQSFLRIVTPFVKEASLRGIS